MTFKIFKRFIVFYLLATSLQAAGISMPRNYNPLVDDVKSIQKAQKGFMNICLNPSKSQLETLQLIRNHTLCRIAPLPSKEGCQDIINCYIRKYKLGGMYKFHIDDTNLTDISILKYFHTPERFVLDSNNIKDLSSLSHMKNIDNLSLRNNPITDITPIESLKLYELRINETPLKDISSLKNMQSIKVLSIGDNVENLEPLNYLKELRLLTISAKNIPDICQIKNLKTLQSLSIKGGNITNIDCLKDLSKLTYLDLENLPLKDVSVIKNFKNLKYLHLTNIPVQSIDAVESLDELSSVGLINTDVKDISVLSKMLNKGHRVYIFPTNFRDNDKLIRCSPKNDDDVEKGKSCYEKNGGLKPFWKRWLGF